MSAGNDGGPAFPQKEPLTSDASGMSLRDYFAAKAMQAALGNAHLPGLVNGDAATLAAIESAAHGVYRIADAMLKAREAQS